MSIRSSNRIDDLHSESIPFSEGAENVNVASALAPKPVIVPDEELAHPEPPAQQKLHEIFGRVRGEPGSKWQHRDVVDARFREDLQLLVVCRQQQRRGRWIHDLEWMWLEGDENAGDFERERSGDQPLHDVAMPAMDAIES